jgi:uncharacterized RDD family membrane protein YckC
MIDAAIFTPCVAYVYGELLQVIDPEADLATLVQVARVSADAMRTITLYWAATVLSFVTYAIIFEAWLGATPGKRILRLKVVDERGARCKFWRIVVRNVMRCVEFFPFLDLAPTLVLIVLTRNRQRLGDLIGATLVVEPAPPETL